MVLRKRFMVKKKPMISALERERIKMVQQNPYAIKNIKNPSERIQLEAVKRNGYVIQDIENPSEKVQLEAVKSYSFAIKNIKNPSEKVQLEAIKEYPSVIRDIKNPTKRVQLEAKKKKEKEKKFYKLHTEKKVTFWVEDIKKPYNITTITEYPTKIRKNKKFKNKKILGIESVLGIIPYK